MLYGVPTFTCLCVPVIVEAGMTLALEAAWCVDAHHMVLTTQGNINCTFINI